MLLSGMMSTSQAEFAWPGGDKPEKLEYLYEPLPEAANAIKKTLSASFPQVASANAKLLSIQPSEDPVGRYCLTTSDGAWFVRVSSRSNNPFLEKKITDYLIERNVEINPLIVAGEKLFWKDKTLNIDVRPFIYGRHFNGSIADLKNLAFTVRNFHHSMKTFPGASGVQAAMAARSDQFQKIINQISDVLIKEDYKIFFEQSELVISNKEWFAEMIKKVDINLHKDHGAQCLHGELHQGNVLYSGQNNKAILIDFEESPHMFMPVLWDVAFLIQRFCLSDKPSHINVLKRLNVFKKEYDINLSLLAPMMRQIAWRSMLIIIDLRLNKGIMTPLEEWEKFMNLEKQAKKYVGFL